MMTKEEISQKKEEIVRQLLFISKEVKKLNEQKSLLIDELIELEPKERPPIFN